jgi:hypothetical protein
MPIVSSVESWCGDKREIGRGGENPKWITRNLT